MEALEHRPSVRSGWRQSLRFQLGTCLALGVLLPSLAYHLIYHGAFASSPSAWNSLAVGISAATMSVFLLRRVSA